MRVDQSGMSLWYGTPDAPAPDAEVHAGSGGRSASLTITVGVQPLSASNRVDVYYRVNGGPPVKLHASLARTDGRAKSQYFSARFPGFSVGDTVEYGATCACSGKQIPASAPPHVFPSSFRVVVAGAHPAPSAAPVGGAGHTDHIGKGTVPSAGHGVTTGPHGGKSHLLKLLASSSHTIADIKAHDAGLFAELQGLAREHVRGRLDEAFANAAKDLQQPIARLDLTKVALADIPGAVTKAITGANLTPALTEDGTHRLQTLENASVFVDPFAEQDSLLRDLPLLLEPLDHARVYVVSDIVHLDDATVAKVIALAPSVGAIDDEVLTQMVTAGALKDAQARDLGLALGLFHLFDDDHALTAAVMSAGAITSGKVTAVRDLCALDAKGWQALLQKAKITPPSGASLEEYAQALARRVGALHPHEAFLRQLPAVDHKAVTESARALAQFVAHEGPVLGQRLEDLSFNDVDPAHVAGIHEAHAHLKHLASKYAGMEIESVIDDPKLSPEAKADAVAHRVGLLDKVLAKHSDGALLSLDYGHDGHGVATLGLHDLGMSADDQRRVVSTLKVHQRLHALTGDVEHSHALLAAGIQSSTSAATMHFDAFKAATGLDHATAQRHHKSARAMLGRTTAAAAAITDVVQGGFDRLRVGNVGPGVKDMLRKLEGFSDLFGTQDYCKCESCRSILGPAAYFVDLMSFVDANVRKRFFAGKNAGQPLDLMTRRPDLWTLELSCENTTGLVPTLVIANEVLEMYIATVGLKSTLTDRAAIEELVFEKLASSHGSFQQPFVLSLERLTAYLGFFGTRLPDIARAVGATPDQMTRAELGIGALEQRIITQPNHDSRALGALFGVALHPRGSIEAKILLRAMSVTRDELGAIVATRFVTAGLAEPPSLISTKLSHASVQNDVERLQPATYEALDRMHRFTRLWRRLPWSIEELDLVLTHLHAGGAHDGAIDLQQVVAVRRAQDHLGESVESVCALWGDLPIGAVARDAHSSPRRIARSRASDEDRKRLRRHLQASLGANVAATTEADHSAGPSAADSLLDRHARLAERLQLSIPQLFQLIGLSSATGNAVITLHDLTALLDLHTWWKTTAYSLDDLGVILGKSVSAPDAYPDTGILAAQVISSASGAFLFADTVFVGRLGVTEIVSRQIVLGLAASVSQEGAVYRLADDFDPAKPLRISADLGVDEGDVRKVLRDYHAVAIVPHRISAALELAFDKGSKLIDLTGLTLVGPAMAQALRVDVSAVKSASGLPAASPLITLIAALVPLTVLFKAAAFDADAIGFVSEHRDAFGLDHLPPTRIDGIRALAVYARFAGDATAPQFAGAAPPIDRSDLRKVLADHDSTRGFPATDDDVLARVLRTTPETIASLRGALRPSRSAAAALDRLAHSVERARALGVSGDALAHAIPSDEAHEYDHLTRAAGAMLHAFQAKHADQAELDATLGPYEDKLLSRKRDALTDYLMHSMAPRFESRRAIYEYFLIDVELEGCSRTSRVVSATNSVQLYVQRCLMDLEQAAQHHAAPAHTQHHAAPAHAQLHAAPAHAQHHAAPAHTQHPPAPAHTQHHAAPAHAQQHAVPAHVQVTIDKEAAGEWEWRKAYRMWEANRKVFLYPENYLEPDLRDDQTPLFKALTSELLQKQIDDQGVLDAYASYVSGFEEVAKLKIAGAYHDIHKPEHGHAASDVLHLVGVSASDPPTFYHRTREGLAPGFTWSPWLPISVQIPVRRVSPVMHLGRLHLFWIEIRTQSANKVDNGSSMFIGYRHKFSLKYTTLRLDGKWTPPQEVDLAKSEPFDRATAGLVTDFFPEIEIPGKGKRVISSIPPLDYQRHKHEDPIDDYTLAGANWEGAYVESGASSLSLVARDFHLTAEIDLFGRTTRSFSHRTNMDAKGSGAAFPMLFSAANDVYSSSQRRWFSHQSAFSNLMLDEHRFKVFISNFDVFLLDINANVLNAKGASPIQKDLKLLAERDKLLAARKTWQKRKIATLKHGAKLVLAIPGSPEDVLIQAGFDTLLLEHGGHAGEHPYSLQRISTTLADEVAKHLFVGGVDELLDLKIQQSLKEHKPPLDLVAHQVHDDTGHGKLNFTGPYGVYYRELFFHIPYLIADHLNSQGQFAAAQRWYHYIFNPTADGDGPDRVWRYREFREIHAESMRAMLTDAAAVKAYQDNPFNPDAIARLRLSAYQKCVVMKYIDNLLDWGDSLFGEFTMESVNEATMLYAMASDILGERPVEVGDCGGPAHAMSYRQINASLGKSSAFLTELESYVVGKHKSSATHSPPGVHNPTAAHAPAAAHSHAPAHSPATASYVGHHGAQSHMVRKTGPLVPAAKHAKAAHHDAEGQGTSGKFAGTGWTRTTTAGWTSGKGARTGGGTNGVQRIIGHGPSVASRASAPSLGHSIAHQIGPVFCVPPNKELFAYWDRVADRLYKIHNCLDIDGVRRDLALFAPELDPRLLMKMKAEGLTLDDVMSVTSGHLPPYRFLYLIEKAKAFASTLQSFGGALLSAMEKKDGEALAKLRVVHEQHLAKMNTQVRQWEIDAANDAVTAAQKQKEAAEFRKDHYQGLIDQDLTKWERTEQIARHSASGIYLAESLTQLVASIMSYVPQVGSPFAMKYGGVELRGGMASAASSINALGKAAEAVAASTGLEATFNRRREDWKFQFELAQRDIQQQDRQIKAAEIRKQIAEKSLEIHQKTIEHTEEVFAFYGDKFTSFGLYTWMAATLQRSHRQAYANALAIARMCETAFKFERDGDSSLGLGGGYWDGSHAGLLSGDQLLLDLQGLERRFIETNYRTPEIEQSFPLTQIDPKALVALREKGSCTFAIPEVFFNLAYPGHYRRRIKAVRLTMPCVTGPYTNVGATLTLVSSEVRANAGDMSLKAVPPRRTVSIATSKAQNDAGVFELSFHDERYMPFEGAGAVNSTWTLELPASFRPFDYETISDVVVTMNYTALDDPGLRKTVSGQLAAAEKAIVEALGTKPLGRLFSLRQEFPMAYKGLLASPPGTPVSFEILDWHFPAFVSAQGRKMTVSKAMLALKTADGAKLDGVQFLVDGEQVQGFAPAEELGGLPAKGLTGTFGKAVKGAHTVTLGGASGLGPAASPTPGPAALDAGKVVDLLFYVEYAVALS